MGLGDKFKNIGHKIKEKNRNHQANKEIKKIEQKQIRQICSMMKLKNLKELCAYIDRYPKKEKTVTETYGTLQNPKFRTRKVKIPQTHELFVNFLIVNCSKETLIEFCNQKGIQLSLEIKQGVVSFSRVLEQKFRNSTIKDFEQIILDLKWKMDDFEGDMEKFRKRIWKQIQDGVITEERILEVIGNTKKSGYSDVFENIMDIIETDFNVKQFSKEDDVQSQLEVFLEVRFPEKSIERRVMFKNPYGSSGEIEIVIDGKFGIEVKVPSSNKELRDMKTQLDHEQNFAVKEVLALIVDADLVRPRSIEVASEEFQNDLGIRTIVKKGYKKGSDYDY